MKSLFIINEKISNSQLEQSYLLILAMLNFEHHVKLVFINNAYTRIDNDPALKQQWLALKLYGIEKFYCLNSTQVSSHQELIPITDMEFEQLKNQADLVS